MRTISLSGMGESIKEYNIDPRLQGRFIYTIWNTEVAKKVIQGSKASLQTSIPPYEAAGMKDKKDMICYNIVVSSYTGGPIQQLTNVLHHGTKGNGYIFESFSQLSPAGGPGRLIRQILRLYLYPPDTIT